MRLTRNQLYPLRVPRVQIPVSQPINENTPFWEFFVYMNGRELNPGKEGFDKDERRTLGRR